MFAVLLLPSSWVETKYKYVYLVERKEIEQNFAREGLGERGNDTDPSHLSAAPKGFNKLSACYDHANLNQRSVPAESSE